MFDLSNKVCLITGSYGHLSSGVVEDLCKRNATVVVSGRAGDRLDEQYNQLRRKYDNVDKVVLDLSAVEGLEAIITELYNKYNRLDVIITNAHSNNDVRGLEDKSVVDLEKCFRTNCTGNFELLRAAIPYLVRTEQTFGVSPSVICFASVYSSFAPKKHKYPSLEDVNPIEYGMAKSAIQQMTKYFAAYYGDKNIRFNSISPGCFPNVNRVSDKEFLDELRKKCPMNRIGEPRDLSGVLVFLSSDASSFITGQNIFVDGGASCWI